MSGLFMRIIEGELPCYKIYEDEHVFSFLARDQVNPGHTLVVPKVEVDCFLDADEPHYSAVFRAAKPIGKAIEAATGCRRVAAIILGLEVPHFHLHLIPIEAESELRFARAKTLGEAQMTEIRDRIVAELG